jgi:hypothetical protein
LIDRRLDSPHQRSYATHGLPIGYVIAQHLHWLVVPFAGAGSAQCPAVA